MALEDENDADDDRSPAKEPKRMTDQTKIAVASAAAAGLAVLGLKLLASWWHEADTADTRARELRRLAFVGPPLPPRDAEEDAIARRWRRRFEDHFDEVQAATRTEVQRLQAEVEELRERSGLNNPEDPDPRGNGTPDPARIDVEQRRRHLVELLR